MSVHDPNLYLSSETTETALSPSMPLGTGRPGEIESYPVQGLLESLKSECQNFVFTHFVNKPMLFIGEDIKVNIACPSSSVEL